MLELVKISVSLVFLVVASVYDYRSREVPNFIWILFIPIALALTVTEVFTSSLPFTLVLRFLISASISIAIFMAVFYLGFFGGADAKALIGLSLIVPWQPSLAKPLLGYALPLYPISIFDNAVLLSLLVLPYALLRNLFWKIGTGQEFFEGLESEASVKKACALIFCLKVKSSKIKPYDSVAEDTSVLPGGEVRKKLLLLRKLEDEEHQPVKHEGLPNYVFINVALPMILFITAGLVMALLIGDVIFWLIISLVFGR